MNLRSSLIGVIYKSEDTPFNSRRKPKPASAFCYLVVVRAKGVNTGRSVIYGSVESANGTQPHGLLAAAAAAASDSHPSIFYIVVTHTQ